MKYVSKLAFLLIMILGITNVQAQDKNNPWVVFTGANAVDFLPIGSNVIVPQGIASTPDFGDKLYIGAPSFGITRYLGKGFSIEASSSYNRINRFIANNNDEVGWFNVDGTLQYNFKNLMNESSWFDPFVGVGGGHYWLDDHGTGTFNANLGFNFWISKNVAITIDTNFKTAFDAEDLDHFQHRAGLKFAIGGKDTDGDGVKDKNDQCPETPGLEELNGCSDSDNDRIADKDDACPDTPGLAEFNGCADSDGDGIDDTKDECINEAGSKAMNGCPDTDNDGLVDKNDTCPNEAGSEAMSGCPDTDNDSVADNVDNCPNEAGPSANAGCPWPDSDGDSVIDKDDQCPDVAGTVANNGCPKVTEDVQKELNDYAKTINFASGKSSISKDSEEALAAILAIFEEYPNAKFTVEGYTDSVGPANINKKLSEERALAVKNYLIANGVDENRLSAVGYGEEKPVASNNTKSGRAQNRRVEINLVK